MMLVWVFAAFFVAQAVASPLDWESNRSWQSDQEVQAVKDNWEQEMKTWSEDDLKNGHQVKDEEMADLKGWGNQEWENDLKFESMPNLNFDKVDKEVVHTIWPEASTQTPPETMG